MNTRWLFASAETGRFLAREFFAPADDEQTPRMNCPAGYIPVATDKSHERHRFDVSTARVIEDDELAVDPAIASRRQRRVIALEKIAELEQRGARPLRELLIDPNNVEARTRLADIDTQIAELRNAL